MTSPHSLEMWSSPPRPYAPKPAQQGISVADHVAHLVVHGVLHLLGYEHERDEDAERMDSLEVKVFASLSIADPYAEAGIASRAELSQ